MILRKKIMVYKRWIEERKRERERQGKRTRYKNK